MIALLNNTSQQLRYEVKFVAPSSKYHDILTWMKEADLFFQTSYPQRRVNSIYFDTHHFDCLEDNLSGMSQRQKARYRWYGPKNTPAQGTLEIKHKKNGLGWKDLFPVQEAPYQEGFDWQKIIASIKEQTPVQAHYYLNLYTNPVLMNNYQRQYFESRNKKIRITIDLEQNFYPQNSAITPNFTRKKVAPDIMTLEVKCDNEHRKLASELLKNIPMRHSRYSKFVAGLIE